MSPELLVEQILEAKTTELPDAVQPVEQALQILQRQRGHRRRSELDSRAAGETGRARASLTGTLIAPQVTPASCRPTVQVPRECRANSM